MGTWATAVSLTVQFVVIVVMGFFLFRQLRWRIAAGDLLRYTELEWWAVAVAVAIAIASGCASPIDPDDSPIDVEVTAEVRQDQNEISFTVVNGTSNVVVYQPRPSALELREDGAWQAVRPDPTMLALFVEIQPGYEHTPGSELINPEHGPTLPPGDYRYKLDLRDEDGNLLPDEARTSNVVRVTPPENPRATARPQADAEFPAHWWSGYRRQLELLQQIPGYAGSYLEGEHGQIVVVLLEDPASQAERARSVLATRVVPEMGSVPTEVRVRKAKYGMIELLRWRDIIPRDVEGLTRVINTYGLSVVESRIRIGVQPGTDRAMLKREIKALGVPLDAVVIEFAGPVILDTGI